MDINENSKFLELAIRNPTLLSDYNDKLFEPDLHLGRSRDAFPDKSKSLLKYLFDKLKKTSVIKILHDIRNNIHINNHENAFSFLYDKNFKYDSRLYKNSNRKIDEKYDGKYFKYKIPISQRGDIIQGIHYPDNENIEMIKIIVSGTLVYESTRDNFDIKKIKLIDEREKDIILIGEYGFPIAHTIFYELNLIIKTKNKIDQNELSFLWTVVNNQIKNKLHTTYELDLKRGVFVLFCNGMTSRRFDDLLNYDGTEKNRFKKLIDEAHEESRKRRDLK